jgi:hypothetical protein
MRQLCLSLLLCAAVITPAKADVIGEVGQHLDEVGAQLGHVGRKIDENLGALFGFLKPSAPEAALAPVVVTPAIRLPETLGYQETQAPKLVLAADIRLPKTPVATLPTPRAEKGSKFLYCVEYARQLSGLNIFGDARHWWARAKGLYERATQPAQDAVMVFTGNSKLKRGHVAVVSHVISNREIRVEQANWLNRGEINYATPIIDVSEKNDWSKVRVFHTPTGKFGSVYAVSGFILQPVQRMARAD